MISRRQSRLKTDASSSSPHLSTKTLLTTSVSRSSRPFKWISGRLCRKQRQRKFHLRLIYMKSLWRIQVRRTWIMKELVGYAFRGRVITFSHTFACFVQNPDMGPLFHFLIWGGKPNLIQDSFECNVNNSELVASDVFLPNEIDMKCPALEQKNLSIAGDWIPGLNHLLSLQAFARGVLTVLATSILAMFDLQFPSSSFILVLTHYQQPPLSQKI